MTTYDPIERVRQARRQAASVAALVAMGVLVVMVIAGFLWTRRGDDTAAPTTTAVRSTGGPDLTWQPYRDGVELPVSQSAGPFRQLEDGRAAGFSQNQLGAVMAAIHIVTRIDVTNGPRIFENTIEEQVIGADAGALSKEVNDLYQKERLSQGRGLAEPLAPRAAVLAGYKLESFAPEAAGVTVFSVEQTVDGPRYVGVRLDMRWLNGDWRLVAPTGGNFSTVLSRPTTLPTGSVVLTKGK